jgi:mannose-6-phosphate isomerase-like protein (cupin superfamily)
LTSIKTYIESGILELYVLGTTTAQQNAEVEQLAKEHPLIAIEIANIEVSLLSYCKLRAKTPNPVVKPFLMATIDYTERIKNGEIVTFPPALNERSVIADYEPWLNRTDIVAPEVLEDVYAKIIGHTATMTTAIVWLKQMAPQEVHDNEIETFLIVEGSCEITIEEEVHCLSVGDMLSIPLYKNHFVKVTSIAPCKIILQRTAA